MDEIIVTMTDTKQRTSRQLAIPGGLFTKALIVIVIVIIFNSFLSPSAFWRQQMVPATTAGEAFRFSYTLPWGRLAVDGEPLQYVPRSDSDYPITIAPGTHTLTLTSDPFPTLSCTFVVPTSPATQQAHQTQSGAQKACQVQQQVSQANASSIATLAFPVHPSLALLAPQQQQALKQATQAYLDTLQGTEIVQAGESYRTNEDAPIHVASKPMQAHLRFVLDTDTSQAANCSGPTLGSHCQLLEDGEDCRLFCTLPIAYDGVAEGQNNWEVAVITRPVWTYANRVSEQAGDQQYTLLLLRRAHGQWILQRYDPQASSLSDPSCALAVGKVVTAIQSAPKHPNAPQANDWMFTSAKQRAMGCVATISLTQPTATDANAQAGKAYVLWRFDVLLAVNDAAHRLLPDLPRASAAEATVVQTILAHPNSIS